MKKITVTVTGALLLIALCACVFRYYHPTHFLYNDRFIIGSSKAKIEAKYGAFYRTDRNVKGEISYGVYMIRDNTPELVMGYDNSLWYEIYFEDGVAVEVRLREGYVGG